MDGAGAVQSLLPRMSRDAGIAALFRREHARLVAYARLIVDDQQTAEDVVQEAFLGLHRRWGALTDEHAAGTVLGATLVAQEIRQHELTWLWEMDLRLENNFLVEG